ncbi:MAG: sulfatase-like hydrolase/transferase, partial [Bacteroidales bacterium]|nr:sulfatase-like hydrolase/transferase [Bacteroidales bacterium]
KWHMGGQRDVTNAPAISEYGFDTSVTNFEGMGPKILPIVQQPTATDTTEKILWDASNLGGPVNYLHRHKITGAYIEHALEFIDSAKSQNKPFYINVWPDDVHKPMFPSLDRWSDDVAERYKAVLEQMDEQFGVLFSRIKNDTVLSNNTIVLICSDNGPQKGFGSPADFKGYKATLYEGGVRSPLIVWGPGFTADAAEGKVDSNSVFAAFDIAPSILSLAGVDVPVGIDFDGEDVMNTMLGESSDSRTAPIFFRRPPDKENAEGFIGLPDLAVRAGDWKLLCDHGGKNIELYNLVDDPGETTNLFSQNQELVDSLSKLVLDRNESMPKDAGVPLPENTTALVLDSLVFYLPFDDNVLDASVNEIVFQQDMGSFPSYASGIFGKSINMHQMRFSTKEDSIFNTYNSHTFAAWIRVHTTPKDLGKNMVFIHQKDDPNNDAGRVHLEVMTQIFGIKNAVSSFTGGIGDKQRTASTVSVEAHKWYHVASVWDRDRKQKVLFLDGEPVDNKPIISSERCYGKMVIGANKYSSHPYLGFIDDLVLVKQALGKKAIQGIMQYGVEHELDLKPNSYSREILKVIPNPNNGVFTVQLLEQVEPVNYEIYSLTGKMVNRGITTESISVDLSLMTPGIYLFKYMAGGLSKVEKIIVN